MATLITIAEFRAIKDLSNHVKETKINSIIEDTEFSDIRPLLGESFFADIKAHPENYTALLTGGAYAINDKSYLHVGLKRVIIELANVRYTFESSETSTPFGIVDKTYADAVHVSRDRAKELSTLRKKTANDYWLNVKLYIENNLTMYPLYYICNDEKLNTFKITNITRAQWH